MPYKNALPKSVTCPKCKAVAQLATDVNHTHRRPVPGSLSICVECTAVNIYGANMQLEPMNDLVWKRIGKEGHKEIARHIASLLTHKASFVPKKPGKRRKK